MNIADITLIAFTVCNSVRVVAYVPQIWKAATDTKGAQAISFATWGLFLASHLTTVGYVVVNRGDWAMASMFLTNAAGCAAILLVAGVRRVWHRRQQGCSLENVVCLAVKRAA